MSERKVILVTGASSGIGAETVKLFDRRGWAVVLAARSADKIESLAAEIEANGGQGLAVPADVTRWDDVNNMVGQAVDHFGRIDVLVNNAGRGMRATVADVDLDDLEYLFRLNVFAPVAALQAVAPIMRQQGGGVIVNVSSVVENMALPFMSPYAASKIALSYLSDAARAELDHARITVVNLLPGATNTNFGQNVIRSGNTGDFAYERVADQSGRDSFAATPEQVAEAVWQAVQTRPRQQYVTPMDQIVGLVARHNPGLLNKLATVGLNRYVPRQGEAEPPASPGRDLAAVGLAVAATAVVVAVVLRLAGSNQA